MDHSRKRSIKKTLTVALLGSVILAAGTATSAFTFSWFSNKNNVTGEIKAVQQVHISLGVVEHQQIHT